MEWKTFCYDILIREHHLDSFGHVNNAVYLQILEEARWDLTTQNGYSYQDVQRLKVGPTILEINLQFKRELKLRQKIKIETQIQSYEGKVAMLRQRMLNEAGELCCEANLKIGLFDLQARKLILPTEGWLKAIGQ